MNNEILKPFNLEEALLKPENVRFASGQKPLEWHYFKSLQNDKYPILSITSTYDKRHHLVNGYNFYNSTDNTLMLIDDTSIIEYYSNGYKSHVSGCYSTLEYAIKGVTFDMGLFVQKTTIKGKQVTVEIVHIY